MKPKLSVIKGGKPDASPIVEAVPEQVGFACPHCKGGCIFYPPSRAVVHSLPACKLWQQIEGKKDDLARFLIKAGLHVLVPEGKA